jgi:hypothetical protein
MTKVLFFSLLISNIALLVYLVNEECKYVSVIIYTQQKNGARITCAKFLSQLASLLILHHTIG